MKRRMIRSISIFATLSMAMLTISTTAFAADSARVVALKKKLITQIDSNGKASGKVKRFSKQVLLTQLNNPIFAQAITSQNVKSVPLNEIKRIDTEWKNAEDELPIHDKMLNNDCTVEIKRLVSKYAAIGETFVMDNQGANVCQNELTSDYWQGDEAKWKNSFNNGAGGIDVGTEKLDRSTNVVLQQFSIPISDRNGQVIGAVTFGIKTENL